MRNYFNFILVAILSLSIAGSAYADMVARARETNFQITYKVTPIGKVSRCDIKIDIPNEIGEKELMDLKLVPRPYKLTDLRDSKTALYVFRNLDEVQTIVLQGRMDYKLRDLNTAKTQRKNDDKYSPADLMPSYYIESNDPFIIEIARKIPKGTELSTTRYIFNEVRKRIKYQIQDKERGALYGLKNGIGDCSEFAYSMAAIARAKGIPARVKVGFAADGAGDMGHAWTEIFFKDYGWVTFDPTGSDFYSLDYSKYYRSNTDIRRAISRAIRVKKTNIGGQIQVVGDIRFF